MNAFTKNWVPLVDAEVQTIYSFNWRFVGAADWMPASPDHEWRNEEMAILDAYRCELRFSNAGYPIETEMTTLSRVMV